jgi:transcriptional regulator with GAF, ATPase, and Fis domain
LYTDSNVITRDDLEEYRELFEEASVFNIDYEQENDKEYASETVQSSHSFEETDSQLRPSYQEHERAPPSESNPDARLLSEIFENGTSLADFKKQIQDRAIVHALETTMGNITRAAEMLGMKRPRLSQIINASESLKGMCQGVSR